MGSKDEASHEGPGSGNRVSSFDLEPNPFEQSFASTKKSQAAVPPAASNSDMTTSFDALAANAGASTGPAAIKSGTNTAIEAPGPPAPIIRGTSTSGKAATAPTYTGPGADHSHTGSTILPPLRLTNPGQASGSMPPHSRSPGSVTPAPLIPPSHQPSHQHSYPHSHSHSHAHSHSHQHQQPHPHPHTLLAPGGTTPGFFLNLPKTGLTPSASGLRSGLTPGILSSAQNAQTQSQLPHQTHPHPQGLTHSHPSPTLHPPTHPVPSMSLPNGQFTPGLSSILGVPLNQHHSPNVGPLPSHQIHWDPHLHQSSRSTTAVNSNSSHSSNSISSVPSDGVKRSSNSVIGSSSSPSSSMVQAPSFKAGKADADDFDIAYASRQTKSSRAGQPSAKKAKINATNNNNHDNNKKVKAPDEPSPYESKDEQERKRKEFLERNRVAASKFRRRKKEYIRKVEGDLKFYESEYEDMSQCMDKLCGISKQTINSSLVGMLKQALLQHDLNSSLALCNHIEQLLLQTQYVQRAGRNPRREEEEKRRLENPDDDNSDYGYHRGASTTVAPPDRYHEIHANIPQQEVDPKSVGSSQAPTVDHATGTINNLPLVINGNTLLSLDDIQVASQPQKIDDKLIDNRLDGRHPISNLKVEDGLS
ncbi:LADA_0E02850g1_1 [Lachancea dasiensis]|uniref:LADA_0E02850g1_1 n=1 Tax=Lachancea dasiensis TaxID=1072105 RepID=A0A1G4JB03_9SACH|nr:LADA_0E02850g1_1 [Lachancea dasiensis]